MRTLSSVDLRVPSTEYRFADSPGINRGAIWPVTGELSGITVLGAAARSVVEFSLLSVLFLLLFNKENLQLDHCRMYSGAIRELSTRTGDDDDDDDNNASKTIKLRPRLH